MMSPPLDAMEPRIRRMIALILANRAAIVEPARGELVLRFSGGNVEAHLSGRLVLDEGEPPKPAA